MSKGYPDYFGFSMFPSYGSITEDFVGLNNLPAGNSEYAFNDNFKGVLYGGYLQISYVDDPTKVTVNVMPDGITTELFNLYQLLLRGHDNSIGTLLSLSAYDPELKIYVVNFSKDLPINNSISVEIRNLNITSCLYTGSIYYSIIKA